MRIEFLYFEGCPNAAETRDNLEAALASDAEAAEVFDIRVEPGQNPSDLPFLGSPSVYVDGVDLVTGEIPREEQFSCRTFTFNDRRTGTIPTEVIRRRIAELRGRQSV